MIDKRFLSIEARIAIMSYIVGLSLASFLFSPISSREHIKMKIPTNRLQPTNKQTNCERKICNFIYRMPYEEFRFESRLSMSNDDNIELLQRHNDHHSDEQQQQQHNYLYNNTVRFRGRVSYDGTGFAGWQVQPHGRTAQGALEKVLSTRFNRDIKIVGAGRTDSGVHARGQAFHFDLFEHEFISSSTKNKDTTDADKVTRDGENDDDDDTIALFCKELHKSLNSMLQPDIRVWRISKAPEPSLVTKTLRDGTECVNTYKWHAIYNAQMKLYTYRISISTPSAIANHPLERFNRVHVIDTKNSKNQNNNDDYNYINVQELERILKHYEGTHDFRAFSGAVEANMRKSGIDDKDTIRTVYKITLSEEGKIGSGRYRIDILLKGALYKMVRNMVGTALDVCKGKLGEEKMLEMLNHSSEINDGVLDTPANNNNNNNNDHSQTSISDGTQQSMKHTQKKKQFVRDDNKCKPAHPEGLTLEYVFYDDDF